MRVIGRGILARRLLLPVWGLVVATGVAAQTSTGTPGTTTTTTTTTTWYSQWWLWAVGVAVFLIVVIALTNRGSRST
jgi:hypothetical protein